MKLSFERVAIVSDLKDEKLHNCEMLKWKIVCFDLSIYLVSLFYIFNTEDIDNISASVSLIASFLQER